MAQDKDKIHQESRQAADRSEQTTSEAAYLKEDTKGGRILDQVVSKLEDNLPDSEGVKEDADKVKERVVQMKDRAQSLGTRATEAARRIRPGSPATGVAAGGALAGSLWFLLRRKRAHVKGEGTWKKAALGLGVLSLIGQRIRSRRRG
jgi:hypothetical protein